MHSSGGAGISGDTPLGRWKGITWILNNLSANFHQSLVDTPGPSITAFMPPRFEDFHSEQGLSPSRLASNLFWRSLPWDQIAAVFGQPSVTDFGCGDGHYGIMWDSLLPRGIGRYQGIDLQKSLEWDQDAGFPRRFYEESVFESEAPLTDLYFSQSALEHFDRDAEFMGQLQRRIASSNRPSFQVHVFPAAPQLLLSGPHGYRCYTRRMVGRLLLGVPSSATVQVFGIGSLGVNLAHMKHITFPKALRVPPSLQSNPRYLSDVHRALQWDSRYSKLFRGFSFLALTIQNGIALDLSAER